MRAQPTYSKTADIEFQAISWHAEDVSPEEGAEAGAAYCIKVYGMTQQGATVSLTVRDFQPFFYVKLQSSWSPSMMDSFRRHFSHRGEDGEEATRIADMKIVQRKDFWGFKNEQRFPFLRLGFRTHRDMRIVLRALTEGRERISGHAGTRKWEVYEANIEPFLRFIHERDLEPTGWMRVAAGKHRLNDGVLESTCDLDISAHWQDVDRLTLDATAPFVVAAFDIECTSSHGDFPVAKKDYKRLAYQLLEVYGEAAEGLAHGDMVGLLTDGVLKAFGCEVANASQERMRSLGKVDRVFPKRPITEAALRQKLLRMDDAVTALRQWAAAKQPMDKQVPLLAQRLADMQLPALEGDPIIQIGTTVHRYGDPDVSFRSIITLGSCDPIAGVEVTQCDSELELLMAWSQLIQRLNPDIITGYNIFGFDFSYIHTRAQEVMGDTRAFMRLGRIRGRPCEFKQAMLSSSALGDNVLKYIMMEGRVLIDVMKVVQRDHKLDSWKLDNVAHHFLGLNKHDISPNDIFRLQKGSAADRRVIAEYCVQDCALCNKLIMKLEMVANNMGMSNVCSVPLSYIFMRGQGVKIFSLVMKQCQAEGFLIPVVKAAAAADGGLEAEDDSYEGAIVLEPKEGVYIEDPVSVLDYASLYPSSMISENLSHDCFVNDPKYDNLPGVEYIDVSYDVYEGAGDKKTRVGEKVCRFAQFPDGRKGMIPNILMKLLAARKATRKKMELVDVKMAGGRVLRGWLNKDRCELRDEAGAVHALRPEEAAAATDAYNDFQKAVLDGLQLAYKVTANSLYGQCGARTSPIYMKEIAACTTATGRKMILLVKDFLESQYKANVIYGDSVMGYTPVLLRVDGRPVFETIERVAERFGGGAWLPCARSAGEEETKEACELGGAGGRRVEAWTEQGWTPVERVIRHRLAPHKHIVRVATGAGIVDVTDDHSLLRADGLPVSPRDLRLSDALLHAPLSARVFKPDIPPNRALATILSANRMSRRAYWDQLLTSCGVTVPGSGRSPKIACGTQMDAAIAFALARSLGYRALVQEEQGGASYSVVTDALVGAGDTVRVHAIRQLSLPESEAAPFVYDLTTANHHFQAGVGELIVHNTDSIFVVFPDTIMETEINVPHGALQALKGAEKGRAKLMPSIQTAIRASQEFKKHIKPPHDAEYEKTFWPFVLLSKKRYVGNLYERDDKKFKQKSMGIVLKRRDNAPIVKKIYGGVLDIILNRQDIAGSIAFLRRELQDLVDGKCALEDLVVSKSLRAEYKDPDRIAHRVLAERMGQRDPGNKPQVNDRIPYVYIETKDKKALQGDRIEAPDFVTANKLRPDYEFYITNQIMKPLLQLYSIVIERIEDSPRPPAFYEAMYQKLLSDLGGDAKKAKDKLMTVKEQDVKQMLFDPVLQQVANAKAGNLEITRWFKPLAITDAPPRIAAAGGPSQPPAAKKRRVKA